MKVTFYGTRGSVPVCGPGCSEFGGNTSCLLLTFHNGRVGILDAGTGIWRLGNDLLAGGFEQHDNMFIGLSHTHWDHIQGFPFFKPAYDRRRHFTIAIPGHSRRGETLADTFAMLMKSEYFPVPLEKMGGGFKFWEPNRTSFTTREGIRIETERHNHPGIAYGYRITEEGKTMVYCTDVEHGDEIDPDVVNLSRDADLLIHDAQYTAEELKEKRGWGHSSWVQAVEVAERAGAKRLALFHHDPEHDDAFLREVERQCQERFPASFAAREGAEIEV